MPRPWLAAPRSAISNIKYAKIITPYDAFGKHWTTGFDDGFHKSRTGAWRSRPSCVGVRVGVSPSVDAGAPIGREIRRATLQQALLGMNGEIVGQINHQTTPASLVTGADAGPIVTMEVLIK